MTPDLWIIVAALLALATLWLLARTWGWHLPGWLYGAVGVAVAFVGGLWRRERVPPPRGPDVEPVRRTAGDILAEKAAADRARIEAARTGVEAERELATLADARRRRGP